LWEIPANIQDFYTFSAKMGACAHISCINAGFFKNGNKIEKYNVLLHHYWIGSEIERVFWIGNEFVQLISCKTQPR